MMTDFNNLEILFFGKVSDPGPFCPAFQALTAPTTLGRPLDLPSRSEPMCLKSWMRKFCTLGNGAHPWHRFDDEGFTLGSL
jgi:hypothetical protein